jgi:hypothetical protein
MFDLKRLTVIVKEVPKGKTLVFYKKKFDSIEWEEKIKMAKEREQEYSKRLGFNFHRVVKKK